MFPLNCLCNGVYGLDAMFCSEVYPLFLPEDLGMPDDEIFYVPTGIGNIIRNPSGTVRNIPGLLKDRDIHMGLISLGTAGSAHARGITAYDDEFHGFLL